MKILLDATGVTRKKAGVGVYVQGLLRALLENGGCEVVLLAQDDDPDFSLERQPGVKLLRVPARWTRSVPLRMIMQQVIVPFLAMRHRIDVLHSPHYFFPLLRIPGTASVVTVHDMTSFLLPDVHTAGKSSMMRFFIRRARKRADGIIFISHSAENDFNNLLGAPRALSTVIHHGKGEWGQTALAQEAETRLRRRYNLPAQFILYIGTIEPRKNLERLVDAFATVAAKHPDVHLVIAGMMGWKQEHLSAHVHQSGVEQKIQFVGFVDEADKPELLKSCVLFVYPSLYEGFGLPVLEALATGVPTVTSRVSAIPEIAGDAAILVDPLDTAALSTALDEVLQSPELQRSLRHKGPLQAANFTWSRTGDKTLAFFRQVMQRKANRSPV